MSENRYLTLEQAQKRFALFADDPKIKYDIILHLPKGKSTYSGVANISFALKNISPDFFLDFGCTQTIKEIVINGVTVPTQDNYKGIQKDIHLHVPTDGLKIGDNTISITFENDYSKEGHGLCSFTDTDNTQYLYSLSEPYHGNRIIPMFDQPDLKAKFQLSVIADQSWTVIYNEAPKEVTKELPKLNPAHFPEFSQNEVCHHFHSTPTISTYLFVVIAGDYKEIVCPEKYKDIQFRIYVRQSLYPYMKEQADEVFDITRAGFTFYEEFFGHPFPFSKYDQIFCPEYASGAMETPGAVTFNDYYVFKDPPTNQLRYWVAATIVHELAHMWFGNLVTMKWWDDLWLNESFADSMAYICMQNAKMKRKYENPWIMFFSDKMSSYEDDEKPTTHPISAEVQNTEMAKLVFDGITYTKGAASLVQLYRLVGHETFSKALKSYFHKYAWKNATLDDFISNLQSFLPQTDADSPLNLDNWKNDWLCKAGLSQIKVEWDPKNESPNATLTIRQTPTLAEFPSNRFIKVKVAFFSENGQLLEVKDTILKKETTQIEYDGSKKPKIVFPNFGDEGFVKVKLDEVSLSYLKNCIHNVQDEITRAVMWYCFFTLVKDGEANPLDYFDAVCNGLEVETSDVVLNHLLLDIDDMIGEYVPIKLRGLLRYKMFEKLYRMILRTDPSEKNKLIIMRRELIGHARCEEHIEIVRKWLDGVEPNLKDQPLRIRDKWSIVKTIYRSNRLTREEKQAYFKKMYEEDPSDMGRSAEKFCEALIATGEEREALWKKYLEEKPEESYQLLSDSMSGFNTLYNMELNKEYFERFYEDVYEVFDKKDAELAKDYFSNLFPIGDNIDEQLERIKKLMEKKPKSEQSWMKALKDKEDSLKRKKRAYGLIIDSITPK